MSSVVASLALLKITWDSTENRRDYLQNFVPFVATLFNQKAYEKVKVNTVCKDFQHRFGFSIPYHPMLAILDRMRATGLILKRNGVFVPVKEKIRQVDFSDMALEQERKYEYVLGKYIEFCSQKYQENVTKEDAEQIFVAFIRAHDIDLLFLNANLRSLLPQADATPSQRYLIYRFVSSVYESDPSIFQFILDYNVGHIFANLLIYQHEALELEQGNLATCKIYLDVSFLFNLTGVNGDEHRSAYLEFIETLRSQKAELFVFRHTYEEFRGIVEGAFQWIGNRSYDPMKANRTTTYFVDNEYSPSDIEQFILDIDPTIRRLGISVIESLNPQVDTVFQIDENALRISIVDIYKARSSDFNEFDKEYTIDRDVKSIAFVHKLRAGVRPTTISDTTHIFVTTNSTLAFANRKLEEVQRKDRFFYIPVVVTDVFLGTVVWLNMPTNATTFNEKRLVAACFAALQPNRELMKRLAEEADRLCERGEISLDEVTLLKQSRVARNLLQDETLGDPDRFTDRTPFDILEEIRRSIKQRERQEFEQERARINTENLKLRTSLESITNDAESAERKMNQYDVRVEHIATRTATTTVWLFYGVSLLLIIYISVIQFVPNLTPKSQVLNCFLIVTAIVLSVINLMIGTNVKDVGVWLKGYIKRRIIATIRPDLVN